MSATTPIQAAPTPTTTWLKTLWWLIKREYWENRGGVINAQAITATIVLIIFTLLTLISTIAFGKAESTVNIDFLGSIGDAIVIFGIGISTLVLVFCLFFYALGSLYDDRRDRSILFWKSLPISDTQTVVSKALFALVVYPLTALAFGILLGIALWLVYVIMLTALSFFINIPPIFSALIETSHFPQLVFYIISSVPVYILWALPTIGWLMFCSAWVKRVPFLWAALIPFISCIIISMMGILSIPIPHKQIWYTVVYRGLMSIVPGTWLPNDIANYVEQGDPSVIDFIQKSNSWHAFLTLDLWIGVVIGTAFIAIAIYLRRWQEES